MTGEPKRWWRDGPRWANLLGFALVAVALVGAVLVIFNTIEAERAERDQVRRTNEILVELGNVGRAAINAETGQRGYFITLDRRYLAPYIAAREQYPRAVARLRELIGSHSTPRQAELLDEIERLGDAKFAELELTVGQVERGDVMDAQRQILTDEGQDAMARLRRAITEMERIEHGILGRASDRAAQVEGRVLPLLTAFLVMLFVALAMAYWQVERAARTHALESHAQELAEARDRADLLARELNHRVKNLFAVILAIVRMSGRSDPSAKPVVEAIAQRIHALLTAHDVTQGAIGHQHADLRALVETTLAPHRTEHTPCEIDGPEIALPAKQVTPLGLVLHELTTNAVKYGAWSQGGTLRVKWERKDDTLELDWTEDCPDGCEVSEGKGFGSQLIDSAARQLDGSITREFTERGAHIRIVLPLTE